MKKWYPEIKLTKPVMYLFNTNELPTKRDLEDFKWATEICVQVKDVRLRPLEWFYNRVVRSSKHQTGMYWMIFLKFIFRLLFVLKLLIIKTRWIVDIGLKSSLSFKISFSANSQNSFSETILNRFLEFGGLNETARIKIINYATCNGVGFMDGWQPYSFSLILGRGQIVIHVCSIVIL